MVIPMLKITKYGATYLRSGKLSDENKSFHWTIQSNNVVFAGINHIKFWHSGGRGI